MQSCLPALQPFSVCRERDQLGQPSLLRLFFLCLYHPPRGSALVTPRLRIKESPCGRVRFERSHARGIQNPRSPWRGVPPRQRPGFMRSRFKRRAPCRRHPAARFKHRHHPDVDRAPLAVFSTWSEADRVPVRVHRFQLAIDPTKAQRLRDRLRPSQRPNARPRPVSLVKAHQQFLRSRVICFQPAPKRSRRFKINRPGCAIICFGPL